MPGNAMNKRIYISIGLLMIFMVVVFSIIIFSNLSDRKVSPQIQSENVAESNREIVVEATEKSNETTFYLVLNDNKIYIYKGKGGELYDYADINYETLPSDIKEQLKYGLYITGETGLYDFLQTYSS